MIKTTTFPLHLLLFFFLDNLTYPALNPTTATLHLQPSPFLNRLLLPYLHIPQDISHLSKIMLYLCPTTIPSTVAISGNDTTLKPGDWRGFLPKPSLSDFHPQTLTSSCEQSSNQYIHPISKRRSFSWQYFLINISSIASGTDVTWHFIIALSLQTGTQRRGLKDLKYWGIWVA